MAVWVLDHEAQISIPARVNGFGDLHATAGQVVAQLGGVGGLEGDVGEPVLGFAGQLGKHLDVLMVVHLEISQQQAAGGVRERERFFKPEIVSVEISRSSQVVGL